MNEIIITKQIDDVLDNQWYLKFLISIYKFLKLKMLSVNYSLNCVTFDPKGKILQVLSLVL